MSNKTATRVWAERLALVVASLTISLVFAEIAFRLVLASDTTQGRRLRKASLYADPFSDDLFWLLRHRWQGRQGRFKPPSHPHPVLGWRSPRIGADYSHEDENKIFGRRPVLLYGDSFAQGMAGVERFQTLLNRDPDFARDHYFLNYGVGGYGVGQIYLMFKNSVDRFENPFVVFSLMTFDLDRSVLSVRVGQKPYFEVSGGELELRGVPVENRPEDYFRANPPRVGSFLWRRLRRLVWLTGPDGTERTRAKKKRVNGAILNAAIDDLEARGLDYTILVFHARKAFRQGQDWRSTWLRSLLDERGVDYLWSYDIWQQAAGDRPIDDLFNPKNVHPTTLGNQIIARAIAGRVQAAGSIEKRTREVKTEDR